MRYFFLGERPMRKFSVTRRMFESGWILISYSQIDSKFAMIGWIKIGLEMRLHARTMHSIHDHDACLLAYRENTAGTFVVKVVRFSFVTRCCSSKQLDSPNQASRCDIIIATKWSRWPVSGIFISSHCDSGDRDSTAKSPWMILYVRYRVHSDSSTTSRCG